MRASPPPACSLLALALKRCVFGARRCSNLRSKAAVWANQEPSAGAMASTLSALASGQPERLLPAPSREVVVEVRSLPDMPGVREISARVDVQAPAEMVWRTLTDYERLAGA